MKQIYCSMNSDQYSNLMTLIREARERSTDSILTCELETEQIDELMEVLL